MGLPRLSTAQLDNLTTSNLSPSQLFETLSHYESEACLSAAGPGSLETSRTDPHMLSLFYSSFFIVHLLTDQVPEARALTQRMPETLRSQDPSLQNCLTLLRALWQNQHAQVYHILRDLPWPKTLQPLVRRYESFFQDKTLIAVSTSYEAIRPAVAANYLGLDEQAAAKGDPSIIQKFTGVGWTWDAEAELLHPKPIPTAVTDTQSINRIQEAMGMLGGRGS
ncbi:COP9 signalosome subunit CSN8 [Penicillium riverlandense]|uniref:COP9 signalosome subunit CSN8 n=1 Tax=Penicillium riverlandense TaxID=1903569 RepID=UPI002547A56E|nr:COP9 signalosome subunit CSN8 [Penicillium riverlandense]KAJ5825779.1 COP9 signalosome subunit CSN8 [Penicillium riverlandense]